MASITIQSLDDATTRRLRLRVAQHSLSMEEEARRLLKESLAPLAPQQLGQRSRNCFTAVADPAFERPARRSPGRVPRRDPPARSSSTRACSPSSCVRDLRPPSSRDATCRMPRRDRAGSRPAAPRQAAAGCRSGRAGDVRRRLQRAFSVLRHEGSQPLRAHRRHPPTGQAPDQRGARADRCHRARPWPSAGHAQHRAFRRNRPTSRGQPLGGRCRVMAAVPTSFR